jgi:hypothetical protein
MTLKSDLFYDFFTIKKQRDEVAEDLLCVLIHQNHKLRHINMSVYEFLVNVEVNHCLEQYENSETVAEFFVGVLFYPSCIE